MTLIVIVQYRRLEYRIKILDTIMYSVNGTDENLDDTPIEVENVEPNPADNVSILSINVIKSVF